MSSLQAELRHLFKGLDFFPFVDPYTSSSGSANLFGALKPDDNYLLWPLRKSSWIFHDWYTTSCKISHAGFLHLQFGARSFKNTQVDVQDFLTLVEQEIGLRNPLNSILAFLIMAQTIKLTAGHNPCWHPAQFFKETLKIPVKNCLKALCYVLIPHP